MNKEKITGSIFRRIGCFLLACMMFLTMMPGGSMTVYAASAPKGSGTLDDPWLISTAEEWRDYAGEGYVRLNADIVVTDEITVHRKSCVDLNGHVLDFSGLPYDAEYDTLKPFYAVNCFEGDYIVKDSRPDADHGSKYVTSGGTVIKGGIITGFHANRYSGGRSGIILSMHDNSVWVTGGTFYKNITTGDGGSCIWSYNSVAISHTQFYDNSTQFNQAGILNVTCSPGRNVLCQIGDCIIEGNSSRYDGVIRVDGAEFFMADTVIRNNVTGSDATIRLYDNDKATLMNCTITGNKNLETSESYSEGREAGGIRSSVDITLEGKNIIKDNVRKDNRASDLCLDNYSKNAIVLGSTFDASSQIGIAPLSSGLYQEMLAVKGGAAKKAAFFADYSGTKLEARGSDLYLVNEESEETAHNWRYSVGTVDPYTLYAQCQNRSCKLGTNGIVSLSMVQGNKTYSGKAIGITLDNTAKWKNAGLAVPSITYYTDTACTKQTTPAKNGAASDGKAPKNAGTYWAVMSVNGIRAVQSFTINKRSVAAPKGLKAAAPTTKGGKNGKITGVSKKMEYSLNSGKTWKAVTGTTITGLSAGKVLVRYKATSNEKAGAAASVKVPDGKTSSTSKKDKEAFLTYKTTQQKAAKKLSVDGDTERCEKLVSQAVSAIGAVSYDTKKSLAKNKAKVDAIITKLKKDLKAQRKKDKKMAQDELALLEGLEVSQSGNKINIRWGKVARADSYDVYVQYCSKNFPKTATVSVKSGKINKVSITKLNGKKIDLKQNYKVYVVAYKKVNGKKTMLGETVTAHVVGAKNTKQTNPKSIQLTKTTYTLKKGRTATIKGKIALVDAKKKPLGNTHAKEFRYTSSNSKIATVSANGKITAKAKGTCYVYVYARNGYAKKVKVLVK